MLNDTYEQHTCFIMCSPRYTRFWRAPQQISYFIGSSQRFREGGFSNTNITITQKMLNPPLLNPPLWTPDFRRGRPRGCPHFAGSRHGSHDAAAGLDKSAYTCMCYTDLSIVIVTIINNDNANACVVYVHITCTQTTYAFAWSLWWIATMTTIISVVLTTILRYA